jgi:hypothetical protein
MGRRSMVESTADSDADELLPEEQGSRSSRRRFRLLLDGGSWALFLIFLVRLLPILMEFDPRDPAWQGQMIDLLVDQGLIAFLGFVLLHMAAFVQPKNEALRRRLRLVRRLAVIAVLGYLLLVPLQVLSSFSQLTEARARKEKFFSQSSRLTEIRETLQQAKTVQDVNVRLQSLLEPELTIEQSSLPLPELRKALLKANDLKQAELSRRLKQNDNSLDSFVLVISRIGSALGWALAFAAGAVPWGTRSTLLERLRRR